MSVIKVILVEDTSPLHELSDSFTKAFVAIGEQIAFSTHIVTNGEDFVKCINSLKAIKSMCVGLHDLHLELSEQVEAPLYNASKLPARIFRGAEHGVEALLTLASTGYVQQKDTLLVVASTYAGSERYDLLVNFVRKYVPYVQITKVGASLANTSVHEEYATDIARAWDDYFGCIAARLRPNYAKGWFADGAIPDPVMKHRWELVDNKQRAMAEIAKFVSSVARVDAQAVDGLIDTLNRQGKVTGVYDNVLRHICGACALQAGRADGKRLNLHGLAFIACAYATSVDVWKAVDWRIVASAELLPDKSTCIQGESLLHSLVGTPGARGPAGVFGILGKHSGDDGAAKRRGEKTVTRVILSEREVKITFAFDGGLLAKKYSENRTQGNAVESLNSLKALLLPAGITVACEGNSSSFVLIIKKT